MKYRTAEFYGKSFTFALNEFPASALTFQDEVEVRKAFWKIHPHEIVFDVGCCYGSYTLPALAVGANKVWAWTPLDFERETLVASLDANGWGGRCTIFPFGCYSKTGFLKQEGLVFSEAPQDGFFQVRPIDSIVHGFGPPRDSWLKIDVEGAELHVLQGATKLLETFRPKILVECHNFIEAGIDAMIEKYLMDFKYRLDQTMPQNHIVHQVYIPA